MIGVFCIGLWLDYLRREEEARLGNMLCEGMPKPGKNEELLEILKISRYRELGMTSHDLYLMLKHLTENLDFKELKLFNSRGKIFFVENSNNSCEFTDNLSAAKKCVANGYNVYMLPNPNGGKTPDFILVRNGKYAAYELKTLHDITKLYQRMLEASLQSDRIMLDILYAGSSRKLAKCVQDFLLKNPDVLDVMLFKGCKEIHVTQQIASTKPFIEKFMRRWDR